VAVSYDFLAAFRVLLSQWPIYVVVRAS